MKSFNHKLFFKIYLLLIIFFHLLMEFKNHEPFETIDYFDYPLTFIALLGVFGYAFNKKVLFPKFWQIYIYFIILWDLYRNFNGFELNSTKSSLDLSLLLSFYFLIYVPTYVAIYLYGHHDESNFVKKRTKLLLVLMSFFLTTNAITYKITYESIGVKNFITHVELDAMTLRMYDQNNSSYLKIMLPSSMIALLYDAGKLMT